jgi:predicted RNA binding protein YcfA (HicA-like mRNA interferase family)
MGRSLKLCSGDDAVHKLQKAGWTAVRKKDSHVMLTKEAYQWTLSVPQHDELGPGLLRKLVRQAGLTDEEFNNL